MLGITTDNVWAFLNLPFRLHLAAGLMIRLLLIIYASYHDTHFEVPYTDVDYRVFTDAARHVVNGDSPYNRHTYRYSPLIAFLMTPNIIIHPDYGKVLFSVFDILIAVACYHLVDRQVYPHGKISKVPSYCAQMWLYHPLSMAISTRGNADAVPCLFIILSIYFLAFDLWKNQVLRYSLAGIFLGLSIHLRLYPLAFSLPMYLSLGSYKRITRRTTTIQGLYLLTPNKRQWTLTVSCILTLVVLTVGMYLMYGFEFLFETYLYHLIRRDTRHNFSILFYYSYLSMSDNANLDLVKLFVHVCEISLLLMISFKFGRSDSLPFALFCQAVVMVAFNSVLTSQYFIWFLSLMPLVAHTFKMAPKRGYILVFLWMICQLAWLFYAYMLEFKNQEVFIYVWLKSVFFFASHVLILTEAIKTYRCGYGFGIVDYLRAEQRKSQ